MMNLYHVYDAIDIECIHDDFYHTTCIARIIAGRFEQALAWTRDVHGWSTWGMFMHAESMSVSFLFAVLRPRHNPIPISRYSLSLCTSN